MNSVLIIVLISSSLCYLQADELQVLNRPAYLSLTSDENNGDSDRLTVSNFASNFMTLLGLSAEQTNKQEEPIFYSSQPLEIPASIWLFHIQGLDHLFDTGFSLINDVPFDIETVQSKLAAINADDAMIVGTVVVTSEADMDNLQGNLKTYVSQMKPETTLKYVVVACEDCQEDEAIAKLRDQLTGVINQIVASDSQTLVMTLATKEHVLVRQSRQTNAAATNVNVTIAPMYSDEYPVMFNLFFWTSLVLGLIIIAIVYVFLNLDPGADTIIYRMTAPRLKVD